MSPLRADAKLVKWPKEGNFAQWSNFLLPLYYTEHNTDVQRWQPTVHV